MSVRVPGTTPYEWPFDGLRADRLAVLVAGVCQRWFGASEDAPAVAARVAAFARAVAGAGGAVVHIEHAPTDRSRGWPELGPRDVTILAGGVDGCFGTDLEFWLRRVGRHQLALTGFGLEGPVHSTLRSLNDRGFECLTLADGCAVVDPTLRAAALSTIEMSGGIFGAVGTTDALLHALKGDI